MDADLPIREDWMTPAPDRLSPEHAEFDALVDAHDASVERAQMGYIEDTSGLFVFNAQTLKDRGYCCSRGCRHCPYDRS